MSTAAATATEWVITGEWATAPNITGSAWRNAGGYMVDEVNDRGLTYRYELVALSLGGRPKATACYGLANLYWEHHSVAAWLDLVLSVLLAQGSTDLCGTHSAVGFTCEQVNHAAQVALGNEDCEGCEPCDSAGGLIRR